MAAKKTERTFLYPPQINRACAHLQEGIKADVDVLLAMR